MRRARQTGAIDVAPRAVRARALWLAIALTSGCGGASRPTASDIYHDPALRRGAVEPQDDTERELLGRLSELPEGDAVNVGGRVYAVTASYESASGRVCRAVSAAGAMPRLACKGQNEPWVFVPDVFGGENPFERTDAPTAAVAPSMEPPP